MSVTLLAGPPDFRVAKVLLLAATAALSAWLAFDTKRALTAMGRFFRGGRPVPENWQLANNPAWIWFYRIDAFVVLIGVVWILASSQLLR